MSFAWLSEVAKASQHIAEVLLQTDNEKQEGRSYVMHTHLWAMEAQGRLAEDQAKAQFHSDLRNVVQEGGRTSSTDSPREYLRDLNKKLRVDLGEIIPRLAQHWHVMNQERANFACVHNVHSNSSYGKGSGSSDGARTGSGSPATKKKGKLKGMIIDTSLPYQYPPEPVYLRYV